MTPRSSFRATPGGATTAVIGSYTPITGGRGAGLTVARLAPGCIELGDTVEAPSPSYAAWAGADVVVAAHETPTGSLGSYRFVDGSLEPVDTVASEGGRPCHVAAHPSGRFVACSNYAGGTFATFPLGRDGSLGAAAGVVEHEGRGLHPTRQDVPHPHSVTFSRDGRWAVLLDISRDCASVHEVDLDHARLVTEPASVLPLPPGAGPRHAALLPRSGEGVEELVVVSEIDASLQVLAWDRAHLAVRHTGCPTSAAGADAWPSEVAATADGTIVVANRTGPSLALHARWRGGNGSRLVREIPLPAANPRHFALVGETAFVALQDPDRVVAVDLVTGEVSTSASTGSPACVAPRPV